MIPNVVDLHRRDARRAGDGVAAVGAADDARRDAVHDIGAGRDRGQQHAARDGLGGGHDVRGAARIGPVLGGKVFSGPAVAALHLIGDEQDPVVVADPAYCLHPLDGSRDEAALARVLLLLAFYAGDLLSGT